MFELTDRVILVTGGSRGIGRAVAEELGRAGASVVVGYRSELDAAAETVRRVLDAGGDALAVPGDVRVPLEVDRLVTDAHRWKGSLHGVVTSAGVFRGDPILAVGRGEWEEVIATDLEGTFRTVQAAVPFLEADGAGSIVTVSSVLGRSPSAGGIPYQSVKAGIEQMTRGLALELAPKVRVNCVAPGFIRTDMNRPGHSDPSFAAQVAAATPLGRWGEPEDVAPSVRFLLSEEAGWITGVVLPVDGGIALP
ncbi:MAG TPA: SDR family oxidoreductase [Thermoplasmata archaeon]|nr:SDR family oxidoreductase [Thermoplasmata archaeon]